MDCMYGTFFFLFPVPYVSLLIDIENNLQNPPKCVHVRCFCVSVNSRQRQCSVSQRSCRDLSLCFCSVSVVSKRTFLWRAAGQRRESEVHDVTADDGGLKESRPRLLCKDTERESRGQNTYCNTNKTSTHFTSR